MTVHQEYERAGDLVKQLNQKRRWFGKKHGAPINGTEVARWLYTLEPIAEKLHKNLRAMAEGSMPAHPEPPPKPAEVKNKKNTPEKEPAKAGWE